MEKRLLAIVLTVVMLFSMACASKESAPVDMAYSTTADYTEEEAGANMANGESFAEAPAAAKPDADTAETQAADAAVRKIIYTADMSVTADDPAAALNTITQKALSLGGYVASSYTRTDDDGAYRCSATLKVPADKLELLIETAETTGKVDSYQLFSDDISLSYYDVQARLTSAKAEETQLLAILSQCETVEDVLRVRESLSAVRSDIESYTAQIRLWDELVDYATLELSVVRTPKAAVEQEGELLSIWKASDVWKKMSRGFANSARFMVNAVSAVGIFLAIALIPAGILFLCIGLPIILHRKKKRKRREEQARKAAAAAESAENTQSAAPESAPKKE